MNASLDIRQLLVLRAVAQTRSATRAAETLHVSQSAVSHQLAEIEGRLGQRLFTRGRAMTPTPAGTRLLAHAARVLDEMDRLERALSPAPEPLVLRLSTGCYTCYHWLPPLLGPLSERVPGAQVEIVLEATRRPLEALRRHRIDLAITSDPVRGRELRAVPLFDDELLAVVASGHRLAAADRVSPRDLASERLLVYDAAAGQLDVCTRFLRPARVRPRALSRIPLTEAIVELARAGHGVAVLARWAARPYLRAGGLRTLQLGSGLRRTWSAVRRRDDPAAPAIDALIELIRSDGGGTGPRGPDTPTPGRSRVKTSSWVRATRST